jgi:hypothetical protein
MLGQPKMELFALFVQPLPLFPVLGNGGRRGMGVDLVSHKIIQRILRFLLYNQSCNYHFPLSSPAFGASLKYVLCNLACI